MSRGAWKLNQATHWTQQCTDAPLAGYTHHHSAVLWNSVLEDAALFHVAASRRHICLRPPYVIGQAIYILILSFVLSFFFFSFLA